MSVSIEALAMAGADYLDYEMDGEEWEAPPAHLLVGEEEEEDNSEAEIPWNASAKPESFSPRKPKSRPTRIGNSPVPRDLHELEVEGQNVSNKKSPASSRSMNSIAGG
ncbi:hypothetical protein CDL15_Pgr001793 [Punica granatum]|uniref:Uncharacterized protein n=1 Tax=Punica granatum TaxID=22663 RepID=A0A218XBZ1_PUNGR|nr:hypothetical protein CDL15_Pgr001793 [Punica granatum]PKI76376.1 hypothetical protein CRG98_003298 [Punica granatum]